jgi:hypothetical protein
MAAYVVKSSEITEGVTGHDDAFPGNVAEEILACVRYVLGSTDPHPAVAIYDFHLLAKDGGIGEVSTRQSPLFHGMADAAWRD